MGKRTTSAVSPHTGNLGLNAFEKSLEDQEALVGRRGEMLTRRGYNLSKLYPLLRSVSCSRRPSGRPREHSLSWVSLFLSKSPSSYHSNGFLFFLTACSPSTWPCNPASSRAASSRSSATRRSAVRDWARSSWATRRSASSWHGASTRQASTCVRTPDVVCGANGHRALLCVCFLYGGYPESPSSLQQVYTPAYTGETATPPFQLHRSHFTQSPPGTQAPPSRAGRGRSVGKEERSLDLDLTDSPRGETHSRKPAEEKLKTGKPSLTRS